jgi:membrane protein implicated in regulation of membrane protease activity
MDSPEIWRWIWLAAAVVFGVGEMATAGAFFLLPFAVGALVASLLAFAGVGIGLEWLAFIVVSLGSLFALRPIARRLDRNEPTEGIGAKRLIGQPALVLDEIKAGIHELGLVRVHREEWRAESVDGTAVPAGSTVRIVDVRGTRVVVHHVPTLDPQPPTLTAGAEQDETVEEAVDPGKEQQ